MTEQWEEEKDYGNGNHGQLISDDRNAKKEQQQNTNWPKSSNQTTIVLAISYIESDDNVFALSPLGLQPTTEVDKS